MASPSAFIRPMHPKTEILPSPLAIQKILAAGWVGQVKIHGHRAQIHVPAAEHDPILVYTRQGKYHRMAMPEAMCAEIRRLFRPRQGWNAIDAEWIKPKEKLFVFDWIKREGDVLRRLTYPQRWQLLPRLYLSPHITTLPLLRDLKSCLETLQSKDPMVEGLVFKSTTSKGFADTSIVRCRRRGTR